MNTMQRSYSLKNTQNFVLPQSKIKNYFPQLIKHDLFRFWTQKQLIQTEQAPVGVPASPSYSNNISLLNCSYCRSQEIRTYKTFPSYRCHFVMPAWATERGLLLSCVLLCDLSRDARSIRSLMGDLVMDAEAPTRAWYLFTAVHRRCAQCMSPGEVPSITLFAFIRFLLQQSLKPLMRLP